MYMDGLTVSKLAAEARVASDTIRFYEKEGLIDEPRRSASGYRLYEPVVAERVRFIKSGQAMGLKLSAIKDLLEIKDQGCCPCGHTSRVIETRLDELDDEIARLDEMRSQLRRMKRSSVNGTYDWCCPMGRKEKDDGKATG